jgi:hypothetical protein
VKTSSAKAKGRRCQDLVRDALRLLGISRGLEDDDIKSVGMGQIGQDILFSPSGLRVFPLDIECKNVESLGVSTTFFKHYKGYASRTHTSKILVHMKNRTPPLVTLLWTDYLNLLEASIKQRESEPKT